ncbi:MAG: hypothetical protein NT166_16150 [Candidatus Aminicenantes bacterium]|nr:hypothetical protein [Candidatus Aminicenantes bacterium]
MMTKEGSLPYLVNKLKESSGKNEVTVEHLWYAVRGALNPNLLINNIAEALRIPAAKTEQLLEENGFGDLVAQSKLSADHDSISSTDRSDYLINPGQESVPGFQDLFSIEFSPPLQQSIKLSLSQHEALSLMVENITKSVEGDAFLALYRKDVRRYYDDFMATDARKIDRFLTAEFKEGYPRYIVNSGIGANEQFNHFVAHLNNMNPDRRSTWLIIDSPRHLVRLPVDASVENTLFMEFSRSGKTEETVKIHEYTSRDAKRIVFANSGPLREIGKRDKNLVLDLPDQVSGRFGRNKTPILLAPMHVVKMDTDRFWQNIEDSITRFDLSTPTSLPVQIAQFIYLYQKQNGVNHIYFGCNDDLLACSADEFLQFWNEGVNKGGNDICMSKYLGLLRDSHINIEGILANHKTKMGIFLLRDKMSPVKLPPMTSGKIDPINLAHGGLNFGDEEIILAEANYQRFSELMPVIKVTVHGDLVLDHAAVLGQLWSDITFFYSRMMCVDPGSNPEVKFVRDRSDELLSKAARKR